MCCCCCRVKTYQNNTVLVPAWLPPCSCWLCARQRLMSLHPASPVIVGEIASRNVSVILYEYSYPAWVGTCTWCPGIYDGMNIARLTASVSPIPHTPPPPTASRHHATLLDSVKSRMAAGLHTCPDVVPQSVGSAGGLRSGGGGGESEASWRAGAGFVGGDAVELGSLCGTGRR